jgi:hypothetical protein
MCCHDVQGAGSVKQQLSKLVVSSLRATVPPEVDVEPTVEVCTGKFGDYQWYVTGLLPFACCVLFSGNRSLLLLLLFPFLPCASVVILPKQRAATMPWDSGQRLKGLVQVSETPMQLDRFAMALLRRTLP